MNPVSFEWKARDIWPYVPVCLNLCILCTSFLGMLPYSSHFYLWRYFEMFLMNQASVESYYSFLWVFKLELVIIIWFYHVIMRDISTFILCPLVMTKIIFPNASSFLIDSFVFMTSTHSSFPLTICHIYIREDKTYISSKYKKNQCILETMNWIIYHTLIVLSADPLKTLSPVSETEKHVTALLCSLMFHRSVDDNFSSTFHIW